MTQFNTTIIGKEGIRKNLNYMLNREEIHMDGWWCYKRINQRGQKVVYCGTRAIKMSSWLLMSLEVGILRLRCR